MSPHFSSETAGLLLQLISTIFGTVMSVCAKVLGEMGLSVFLTVVGSRVALLIATLGALFYQQINPLKSERCVYTAGNFAHSVERACSTLCDDEMAGTAQPSGPYQTNNAPCAGSCCCWHVASWALV
jgi:hypothetical protein